MTNLITFIFLILVCLVGCKSLDLEIDREEDGDYNISLETSIDPY